ncbi:MAG: TIR domain-containing protein [Bacteroidetes bacterium]|nr:TIR domain-containing protein [Bacteroidota bacterium]
MIEFSFQYHLFIAYSAADHNTALQLYRVLCSKYEVFLDTESLLPGDCWDEELIKAQQQSLITVVLISPNIDKSYYQQEEIAAAIDLARDKNNQHRIVPIYLNLESKSKNIPYGLRRLHAIYINSNTPIIEVAQKIKRVFFIKYKIHEELKEKGKSKVSPKRTEIKHNKKDDEIISSINLIREVNQKRKDFNLSNISLLYIDVDGLTHINKIFGKEVADEVISVIEKILSKCAYIETRTGEVYEKYYFVRRGEDEFLFCLTEYSLYALSFGGRICDIIKNYDWIAIAPELRVTISVGVIELYCDEDTVDGIIRAYFGSNEAKKLGGNKAIMGPKFLSQKISKNLRDYGSG